MINHLIPFARAKIEVPRGSEKRWWLLSRLERGAILARTWDFFLIDKGDTRDCILIRDYRVSCAEEVPFIRPGPLPLTVVSIFWLWVYQETTHSNFHWSFTIDLQVGRNHGRLEAEAMHSIRTSPFLSKFLSVLL